MLSNLFPTPIFLIIGIGFLFWLLVLTFFLWRQITFYNRLTEGTTKKNLQSVLDKLLLKIGNESERIDKLTEVTNQLRKDNPYYVQKIGLVRFNPFDETGGNQSFCLTLLDGEDSGLVISSLHSREATRIYAKPVTHGKAAGYDLSNEEQQAIKQAKRIK